MFFRTLLLCCVILGGVLARMYFSTVHSGRVWIDELWVFFNPAFYLKAGVGFLNPMDWLGEQGQVLGFNGAIRSWIPPLVLSWFLRFFDVFGWNGSTVTLAVRIILGLWTIFGLMVFLKVLQKVFQLKNPPVLAAFFLFFTPEFIRHGSSGDLSVLAFPLLSLGLYFYFCKSLRLGFFLLGLASVVRPQYVVIPFLALLFQGRDSKNKTECICSLSGVLYAFLLEIFINTFYYQKFSFPFFQYFYLNSVLNKAASFGTSPFSFGFEILAHFMTEVIFTLSVVVGYKIFKGENKERKHLFLFGSVLALLHCAVRHKEFRFFYGPALLLSGITGAWLESMLLEKKTMKITGGLIVFAFICDASLRGIYKTAWAEFDQPSQLETLAGTRADLKGLVTVGWGGIRQGGQYHFYNKAPYEFAETLKDLKARGLDLKKFNYLVTHDSVAKAPCVEVVTTEHEIHLYRCTENELIQFLR